MYRLNPLQRNVLITVDEVIFHAATKQTFDPNTIRNSVIIAEERFIRPALGYAFYAALAASKNLVVAADNKTDLQTKFPAEVVLQEGYIVNASEFLSAHNLVLWKEYLWKLIAEAVMLVAIPDNFVQFSAEGVIHNTQPASPMSTSPISTPELRSVKWTMDKKMMDRIDPLTEAMHEFICKYKLNYPLYEKSCDCDSKGVAYRRKTDILLGLYDD